LRAVLFLDMVWIPTLDWGDEIIRREGPCTGPCKRVGANEDA